MLRSIVLLPGTDPATTQRWLMVCATYCASRSYEIVAVVATWRDAWKLIHQGHAAVLVTGRRDHLPAGRLPRLEVVAEQTTPAVSSEWRRPKRRMVRRRVE